ncbi:hypothetical protein IMZ48_44565 [Candidatus Bathyarchaeota archaeon]|nr:hypothetical protein [Candidatus Bathyarchaeota archaeon]
MVTCAFYDEFWCRHDRWTAGQDEKENVRNICQRAFRCCPNPLTSFAGRPASPAHCARTACPLGFEGYLDRHGDKRRYVLTATSDRYSDGFSNAPNGNGNHEFPKPPPSPRCGRPQQARLGLRPRANPKQQRDSAPLYPCPLAIQHRRCSRYLPSC